MRNLVTYPDTEHNDARQPCICFVHQGKTAGTAIVQTLASFFEPHEIAGYAISLPERIDGLSLLGGHFRFEDFERIRGEKIFITSMRHPTPRLISLYRYWKSFKPHHAMAIGSSNIMKAQQLSFTELLRTDDADLFLQIDNPSVRQFCSPTAIVEENTLLRRARI